MVLVACVGFSVGQGCSVDTLKAFKEGFRTAKPLTLNQVVITDKQKESAILIKCTETNDAATFLVSMLDKLHTIIYTKKTKGLSSTIVPANTVANVCAPEDKTLIDTEADQFMGWNVKVDDIKYCKAYKTDGKISEIQFIARFPGSDDDGDGVFTGVRDITCKLNPANTNVYNVEDVNVSCVGDLDLFAAFLESEGNLAECDKTMLASLMAKLQAWTKVKDDQKSALGNMYPLKKCSSFTQPPEGKRTKPEVNALLVFGNYEDWCGFDYRDDGRGDWYACVDMEWSPDDDFRRLRRLI